MSFQYLRWIAQGGLRVVTSDVAPEPNTCLIADNCDMRATRAIRPLEGYEELTTAIAGGGTLDPYQIGYRGDELVAWDTDDRLYSLDPQVNQWRQVGSWTQADLELFVAAPRWGDQVNVSADAISDYLLVAWEGEDTDGTPGVQFEIIRESDRASIASGTVATLSGAVSGEVVPLVVALGTDWAVLYHDPTGAMNRLRIAFVSSTTLAVSVGPTTVHTYATAPTRNRHDMVLGSGVVIVGSFDIVAAIPTVVVATINTGGQTVNTFASPLLAESTPAVTFNSPNTHIILSGLLNNDRVMETIRINSGTLALVDSATHTLDAADTFDSLVALQIDSTDTLILAGSEPTTAGVQYTRYIEVVTADVSAAPTFSVATELLDAAVSHKPCTFRSRQFVMVQARAELFQGTAPAQHTIQTSECYLLYDLTRREVVGRCLANGRAGVVTRNSWPPLNPTATTIVTMAESSTFLAGEIAVQDEFVDANGYRVTWTLTQVARPTTEHLGAIVMATGGMTRGYDGRDIFELDYHILPVADVTLVVGGGALSAGTYVWATYFQWEDNFGQLYRSAPALVTHTAALNDSVDLTVFGAPHTGKTNVQVGFARTIVNDNTVFHELLGPATDRSPVPGGTFTFTDIAADTAISDNTTYDQAGVPATTAHQPTAAARFVTAESDRLWFGDPEESEIVHFSLPCLSGFGPGLNPTLIQGVCDGLPVNALAELDGTFYAIGATGIVYWQGDGPDRLTTQVSAGPGGGFSLPRRLPTTLGVSSQLLVDRTLDGLAYVSPLGLRMLGRDRASAAPFSALDELLLHEGMTASRLLYLPGREETVVYSSDTEVLPGPVTHPPRTVRFAHATARWSSEGNAQALHASRSQAGQLAFVRVSDSRVCRYLAGSYLRGGDDPSQYPICTNWLTLAGVQEFVIDRVIIRGRFLGDFDLFHVALGYDFNDPFHEAESVDPNPTTPTPVRTPLADATTPPAWMQTGLGFEAQPRSGADPPPLTRFSSLEYTLDTAAQAHAVRVAVWSDSNSPQVGEAFALTQIDVLVSPVGQQAGNLLSEQSF